MNQPSDPSQTDYNYKTNPYPSLKKKFKKFPFDSIANQIFLSSSAVTDRFQCYKRIIRIAKTYSEKGRSETTVATGFLVFRVDSHVVYSRIYLHRYGTQWPFSRVLANIQTILDGRDQGPGGSRMSYNRTQRMDFHAAYNGTHAAIVMHSRCDLAAMPTYFFRPPTVRKLLLRMEVRCLSPFLWLDSVL